MELFRKIRQRLAYGGSLKRYLIYACGEILLIMIGVLLAFQVGNWKEKRSNKKAEFLYYQNIRRQLSEDKDLISRNIDYNNRYLSQFTQAIQIIEEKDHDKTDILVEAALNLIRYSDFHRASNIYETIVNSGQIELIHNHEVIEGLQRLEETYVYINRMEDIHFDIIKITVLPDLLELVEFSPVKAEMPDELYTFEFKNRFTLLVDIMNEKNEVYQRAIYNIDEIIDLIDTELTHETPS